MSAAAAAPFFFVANLRCLDFANTEPVLAGGRVDLVEGFSALLRWLREAGVLDRAAERRARQRWEGTAEAAATLTEARALRAAIRQAAERLASGRNPGAPLLGPVNRVLASRPAYARLVRDGEGYRTRLEPVSASALQLLVPVAESAAWLLEHGDPALVRRCEGPGCVLLFYDTTKNHSRRWCSMDACGSRAKAGAYYRRHRARA